MGTTENTGCVVTHECYGCGDVLSEGHMNLIEHEWRCGSCTKDYRNEERILRAWDRVQCGACGDSYPCSCTGIEVIS